MTVQQQAVVNEVCGRNEDLVHRFWTCPHSASAWTYLAEQMGFTVPAPPKLLRCHADLKGWLLDWIGKADEDQVNWMFMLIYQLWSARNDAGESRCMEDPKTIATRTKVAIDEWRSVQNSVSVPANKPKEHWLCPEEGWMKVNVDGAFRSAEGNGGGGVVIRDHHGSFASGANYFLPHAADAEHAVLLACRKGLVVAQEIQVQNLVLETDSMGVVAKLCREEQDRSVHEPLIEEIKNLLKGFGDHLVRAVRRSANEAAHILAKLGCDNVL